MNRHLFALDQKQKGMNLKNSDVNIESMLKQFNDSEDEKSMPERKKILIEKLSHYLNEKFGDKEDKVK